MYLRMKTSSYSNKIQNLKSRPPALSLLKYIAVLLKMNNMIFEDPKDWLKATL